MAPPARRPRLAVIVANGITGDSRVQKIAIAAARDGWDVTLIGAGGTEIKRTRMGPIEVVRLPVRSHMRQELTGHPLRRRVTQFGISDKQALARRRAIHQAWVRQATAEIGWLRGDGSRSGARKLLGAAAEPRPGRHGPGTSGGAPVPRAGVRLGAGPVAEAEADR